MGKKYLTPSKYGFTATSIDDIGEVDTNINGNSPYTKIVSACVGGVEKVTKYRACLTCKGEVLVTNATIGHCSVCKMGQRLELCPNQLSTQLLIIHDNTRITLTAFLPTIQVITGNDALSFDTVYRYRISITPF